MSWTVGGLCLAFVGAAACGACGSLDKDEVLDRVRALPKNAVLAGAPLERRALPAAPSGASAGTVLWMRLPRPGAPRVVLVHGTPGTLYHWSRVLEAGGPGTRLADAFDVTLIELPGHGVHPDPGVPGSFAALAEHLSRGLRALDLGPVILVGHSYGGEVALHVALDHPDLVAALVLADSAGLPRADDEWLPEERAMREMWLAGWGWLLNSPRRVRTALAPHFRGPIPDGTLEEFVLTCSNAANWRTMVALARDENGSRAADLGALTVPTLLVWGDRDVAYPAGRFARRLLETIPDAELLVIEDCGHYPTEERPEAFVDALRSRWAPAAVDGHQGPGGP